MQHRLSNLSVGEEMFNHMSLHGVGMKVDVMQDNEDVGKMPLSEATVQKKTVAWCQLLTMACIMACWLGFARRMRLGFRVCFSGSSRWSWRECWHPLIHKIRGGTWCYTKSDTISERATCGKEKPCPSCEEGSRRSVTCQAATVTESHCCDDLRRDDVRPNKEKAKGKKDNCWNHIFRPSSFSSPLPLSSANHLAKKGAEEVWPARQTHTRPLLFEQGLAFSFNIYFAKYLTCLIYSYNHGN